MSFVIYLSSIGTHSVADVHFNISSRAAVTCECIFYAGSYAIGCFVLLKNMASDITYCIVSQRFFNISVNTSCQTSVTVFENGKYLLQVYDISNDNKIATFPAVIKEVLIEAPTEMVSETLLSRK